MRKDWHEAARRLDNDVRALQQAVIRMAETTSEDYEDIVHHHAGLLKCILDKIEEQGVDRHVALMSYMLLVKV